VNPALADMEEDPLPISALQHLAFCERQCALIHLEGMWSDNRLTAQGSLLHHRVHDSEREERRSVVTRRYLPLRSFRLGLSGIADVVEFNLTRDEQIQGVSIPGRKGRYVPFPVEYKRGRPKPGHCDTVQLCAQALCLEEMLGVGVSKGALYYGEPRRRHAVAFDEALRAETEQLAARLHELLGGSLTPYAWYGQKCRACSLINECLPRRKRQGQSAKRYLSLMLRDSLGPKVGESG
jgi:CRISPR-associated exonuclease Cas4